MPALPVFEEPPESFDGENELRGYNIEVSFDPIFAKTGGRIVAQISQENGHNTTHKVTFHVVDNLQGTGQSDKFILGGFRFNGQLKNTTGIVQETGMTDASIKATRNGETYYVGVPPRMLGKLSVRQ